jgi:hypothetical protein
MTSDQARQAQTVVFRAEVVDAADLITVVFTIFLDKPFAKSDKSGPGMKDSQRAT